MTNFNEISVRKRPLQSDGRAKILLGRRAFIFATCALIFCFTLPLYHWMRFALQSDFYSYILLVPFISGYLAWQKRKQLPPPSSAHRTATRLLAISGLVVLGVFWILALSGVKLNPQDSLVLTMLSLLLFFWSLCAFFLGKSILRANAFPIAFLAFMIPLPMLGEHVVESILQHGSAPPALWLFKFAGTPVFQQDLIFQLPGIRLQIAPECSGIRSTLVLFMTSLVAGHLFLRSPWKCAVLTLAMIPLALLRNGFRVFTIGELCVNVGPHMIDSPIHHRGGPIFFLMSLVPFFFLLYLLVKSERSRHNIILQSAPH